MPTEPDFNEEDIEDSLYDELPTDNKNMFLTKEDQESYDGLKDFFNNAWIH